MTQNSFASNKSNQSIYFSEKLHIGLWQMAFMLLMTVSLGIAYGHAYGFPIGMLVGGTSSFLAIVLAFVWAPKVTVTNSHIKVAKAKLELQFVGDAKLLNAELTKKSVRQPSAPPGFQLIRPWISESIVVIVSDTTDPHPFWQVSSRQPKALLVALNSAKLAMKETRDES